MSKHARVGQLDSAALDAVVGGMTLGALSHHVARPRAGMCPPIGSSHFQTDHVPMPPENVNPSDEIAAPPTYVAPPTHVAPPPEVTAPYEPPAAAPPAPTLHQGMMADVWFSNTGEPRDPLLLDLDGSGISQATNVYHDGVNFDMNVDTWAERTGWTRAEGASTDAFLVLDDHFTTGGARGITSGAELFGDSGSPNETGFSRLAACDSNADGVFDASDPLFSQVELWQDFNHNGASEENELSRLSDHHIVSIQVAPTDPVALVTENGELVQRGTFTFSA